MKQRFHLFEGKFNQSRNYSKETFVYNFETLEDAIEAMEDFNGDVHWSHVVDTGVNGKDFKVVYEVNRT